MYSYFKGELAEILPGAVILEVNQIGYEIQMPEKMLAQLPAPGSQVQIFTYLNVREDAMNLFGFLSRDALELFQILITVNGIGPKAALAILSVLSPDELRFAVLGEDEKTIAQAPGVGNKTAKRLIMELKDKFSLEDAFEQKLANHVENDANDANYAGNRVKTEALQALTALGYSSAEALQVLQKVDFGVYTDVEAVLKEALKKMALV
ncbi:MAG: Holliday junction branch migration protein RuvA [Eubacterium sp.]|nr:Holliday junction branch migration protein RuvA [Eubacterium sp.]